MNLRSVIGISLLAICSLQSCKKDDVKEEEKTYKSELTNLTTNVIVATYADLASKAVVLLTEAEKLKANPSAVALNNARGAWRDARAPWESSEGFLFGPVDAKGIDPAIDDWPVNVIDLDAVLSSSDALTESYIDGLETGLKGFHTIEYLLWSADGSKEISEFTDREMAYLVSTVENLKNKVAILADSWTAAGDNYGKNIIEAGETGSIFISQNAALEQLTEAIIGICDEVAATKIASPLGDASPNPVEEESRFSNNSKNDFANNIKSISNIYHGNYNVGAEGLSNIVKDVNSTVDQNIISAIVTAIEAIDNIPGNFSDAIYNNRTEVANAKEKVQALQLILENDLKPIISNLK